MRGIKIGRAGAEVSGPGNRLESSTAP